MVAFFPNGRRSASRVAKLNEAKVSEILLRLAGGETAKDAVKALHGAITELAKPEGILSVTSMNQLVHNQKFSISSTQKRSHAHTVRALFPGGTHWSDGS